jgi:hypothetical protein
MEPKSQRGQAGASSSARKIKTDQMPSKEQTPGKSMRELLEEAGFQVPQPREAEGSWITQKPSQVRFAA